MLSVRNFVATDADWVLAQHVRHYAEVEKFDARFGIAVERAVSDILTEDNPASGCGWIAEIDGQRSGCIFLSRAPEEIALVRLFFTAEEFRGRGVGQKLLCTFEASAASIGCCKIRVNTFAEHADACRMYARNDYLLKDSFETEAFGRALTEQCWEKSLPLK